MKEIEVFQMPGEKYRGVFRIESNRDEEGCVKTLGRDIAGQPVELLQYGETLMCSGMGSIFDKKGLLAVFHFQTEPVLYFPGRDKEYIAMCKEAILFYGQGQGDKIGADVSLEKMVRDVEGSESTSPGISLKLEVEMGEGKL